MSTEKEAVATREDEAAASSLATKVGRRKLILIAAPVLLLLLGAGSWVSGLAQHLVGGEKQAASSPGKPEPPVYVDLPEMVANLDSDPRRPRYIKLRARIETARQADAAAVTAAIPRLEDLFQTYLRDMRPDELRGSAGTYRLREELIARANVATAPAKVRDVLFVQLLVQ